MTILYAATTFFPVYILKHQTHAQSLYGIQHIAPWLWIVPICFALSVFYALKNTKRDWWLSLLLTVLGIAGALIVNSLTDPNAATPEPYTTIVIVLYAFFLPGWAVGYGLRAGFRLLERATRKSRQAAASYITAQAKKYQKIHLKTSPNLFSGTNQTPLNYRKGALYAIAAPIIYPFIRVVLWRAHFTSSITACFLVIGTTLLYQKGAGSRLLDKRALRIIIWYSLCGIIVSVPVVFIDMGIQIVQERQAISAFRILTNHLFWTQEVGLLKHSRIVRDYAVQFISGLIWGAIGLRSVTYGTSSLARQQARLRNEGSDWTPAGERVKMKDL